MRASLKFLLKGTPLAAVFMATTSVGSQSPDTIEVPPPKVASVVLVAAPVISQIAPVAAIKAPLDPVKGVVETFRADFLSRVASHKETLFNKCFTRDDGPADPFVVNLIRSGSPALGRASLKNRKIDYTLPPIVVLDPGHGAAGDRGANENGLHEVGVIDALTPKIKAALEQKGAYVVLTRGPVKHDEDLGSEYKFVNQDRILQWRAELVYELAAAFPERPLVMLSIHADIVDDPDVSGAGVFYYSGTGAHSPSSADLSYSLAQHYRTNNGSVVKVGDYAVERCAPIDVPAALLEAGQMKNPDDFEFMKGLVASERKAARAGEKVASGIISFIDRQRQEQLKRATPTVIANGGSPTKHL